MPSMVAPCRCLSRSSYTTNLKHRPFNAPRSAASRILVVRNVVSGTPTPTGAKKLSIALGAAVTGAGALALAFATADQGTDVVQSLSHYPLELWNFYQISIVAHPLQSKVGYLFPTPTPPLPHLNPRQSSPPPAQNCCPTCAQLQARH